MEITVLRKLGGLALIVGGILLAIYAALFNLLLPVELMESDFSRLVLSPAWIPVCAIALVAVLLLTFGFIAAYSVISTSAGILGFAGFVTLTSAYLLQFGQLITETFIYPAIVSNQDGIALFRGDALMTHPAAQAFDIIFIALMGAGIVIFGIALIRSKVYPIIGGILLILGIVLYAAVPVFFVNLAGILIFAAACSIIGRATSKAA